MATEHQQQWAAMIKARLTEQAAFRPRPEDIRLLALALLPNARSRADLPTRWTREAYDSAPPRSAWRDGYASALLAAAEQGLAIQADVRGDQAPSWDALFRDGLGGPDIRLVDA